jgi:hypothetical protein
MTYGQHIILYNLSEYDRGITHILENLQIQRPSASFLYLINEGRYHALDLLNAKYCR